MRILIATQHLGIVGGVETYLRAILPRLQATFHLGILAEHRAVGESIIADCSDTPVWLADGDVAATMRSIAAWRPDVVYSHGLNDPQLEAALTGQFPTVLFAHNYHGTCVSGTKCHANDGYSTCQRNLGPGCLAMYLPCGCGGLNPVTMARLYRVQRQRQAILDRYCAVLVASRHMLDEYRRHGVAAKRLLLAPLFPTQLKPDPSSPPRRRRVDRVLFVGRITRQKGLNHLVEAVARAADQLGRRLTLVVAGDGADRTASESAARARGVPAEFVGWVEGPRRTAEMRNADVLAVPSVWPEPFGLVGVEAGCVGLPAVAYAVGGIPDWLEPGVTGELAPGSHPEPIALAKALVRALDNDDHRYRLGVGAWEMSQRFSMDAHLTTLVPVLGEARRLWRDIAEYVT